MSCLFRAILICRNEDADVNSLRTYDSFFSGTESSSIDHKKLDAMVVIDKKLFIFIIIISTI